MTHVCPSGDSASGQRPKVSAGYTPKSGHTFGGQDRQNVGLACSDQKELVRKKWPFQSTTSFSDEHRTREPNAAGRRCSWLCSCTDSALRTVRAPRSSENEVALSKGHFDLRFERCSQRLGVVPWGFPSVLTCGKSSPYNREALQKKYYFQSTKPPRR